LYFEKLFDTIWILKKLKGGDRYGHDEKESRTSQENRHQGENF